MLATCLIYCQVLKDRHEGVSNVFGVCDVDLGNHGLSVPQTHHLARGRELVLVCQCLCHGLTVPVDCLFPCAFLQATSVGLWFLCCYHICNKNISTFLKVTIPQGENRFCLKAVLDEGS